jgi:hypothetical protein
MIRDMEHASLGGTQLRTPEAFSSDELMGRHFHPILTDNKDLTLLEILNSPEDEWLWGEEEVEHDQYNVLPSVSSRKRSRQQQEEKVDEEEEVHAEFLTESIVTIHDEREDEDDTERSVDSSDSLLTEDSFDTHHFRSLPYSGLNGARIVCF